MEFNLYLPIYIDNRKDMQVLTTIRKDILNIIMIKNKIDLVSHLYCIILDIKKHSLVSRKYSRKIGIVNDYAYMINN